MAQPFTRGAVHLWLGFPNQSILYLGTGERAPRVGRRRRFKALVNDLGGEEDFDVSYQGSSAVVVVKLTRWNEAVLLAAENVPAPVLGQDAAGVDPAGAIGTLLVTQGQALQLWVMYSYAPGGVAPQAGFAALRPGWHFLAAWLGDEDSHEGGTDPATTMLTFTCKRVYNPSTGALTLYDRNFGGLPAIN